MTPPHGPLAPAEIREIAAVNTADPNYQPQTSQIAPGSPLMLSPENKYTLTGTYTLPLSADLGRISIGGNRRVNS